ncbi:MAG: nucleoside-diphosphate kinase, partial [Bacteroidales bacterium]|nr:nucleoside-diphosphate kinase [Bacteroidales bacterium]
MTGKHTLTIIKPLAVKQNNAGNIIAMILKNGFNIVALKQIALSQKNAGEFYDVHHEKPFYNDLTHS